MLSVSQLINFIVAKSFMKDASILALSISILVFFAMLSGCVGPGLSVNVGGGTSDLQRAKYSVLISEVSTKVQNNADTASWHEQRQNLALATGDRIFDKEFSRVFDSLVQAVASLEIEVNNMERQSGYIAATGIALPPAEGKALGNEAINEWCRLNNIDSSILDLPAHYQGAARDQLGSLLIGTGGPMTLEPRKGTALTFQLVKIGANQTKVKLRFSGANYPRAVEAYYKLVWQAVDKQTFVDKNIEGAVEKRE